MWQLLLLLLLLFAAGVVAVTRMTLIAGVRVAAIHVQHICDSVRVCVCVCRIRLCECQAVCGSVATVK